MTGPAPGGLIAAGGIIAPVIPPSIGLILIGVAGNLSITKLFLYGIFPGLLMGLSLCIAWWLVARRENIQPPPRRSSREVIKIFMNGIWALLLPLIIILGLKFGIFTPTEAGGGGGRLCPVRGDVHLPGTQALPDLWGVGVCGHDHQYGQGDCTKI